MSQFDGCLLTNLSAIRGQSFQPARPLQYQTIGSHESITQGSEPFLDSFITGVAHDRLYIDNCQIQFDVAQTAVVGVIETSGNATNVWIKDSLFRSNVDGALFLDFNGTANSGGVTNCYFSSLDVAGAVTAGFDFTGGHIFECYVAGEADTYGIIGGGAIYDNA